MYFNFCIFYSYNSSRSLLNLSTLRCSTAAIIRKPVCLFLDLRCRRSGSRALRCQPGVPLVASTHRRNALAVHNVTQHPNILLRTPIPLALLFSIFKKSHTSRNRHRRRRQRLLPTCSVRPCRAIEKATLPARLPSTRDQGCAEIALKPIPLSTRRKRCMLRARAERPRPRGRSLRDPDQDCCAMRLVSVRGCPYWSTQRPERARSDESTCLKLPT